MRQSAVRGVLLCACMAGAETRLAGGQILNIRVSPAMAREPAVVKIVAMVEPDERNRVLEFKVESAEYETASRMQLGGLNARRHA